MSALLKANTLPHYVYADYAQWENEWELIEGASRKVSS